LKVGYAILRLKDGVFFCCRFCACRVRVGTGKQGMGRGSARTLAASEINQHLAATHPTWKWNVTPVR
jgi:hypothetical protein